MPHPRACPYCRQLIKHERCGVFLPPLKAGIFDLIRAAGDAGISSAEIVGDPLYRERWRVSRTAIKSHVWQINELLDETNWVIRAEGDYGTSERRWYLRRRRRRRVMEAAE